MYKYFQAGIRYGRGTLDKVYVKRYKYSIKILFAGTVYQKINAYLYLFK